MRKLVVSSLIFLAIMLAIAGFTFRRYAYAIVWHKLNGDYAQLAGHTVKLPALWWEGSDETDGIPVPVLTRAYPAMLTSVVEIKAERLAAGTMCETDQDASKIQQLKTSVLSRKATKGWSLSNLSIHSKSFTLYCIRNDVSQIEGNLWCIAPKFPNSISYFGSPKVEKEAEAILSTLE